MTDEGRSSASAEEMALADEELRAAEAFVVDEAGAREELTAARAFVAEIAAALR